MGRKALSTPTIRVPITLSLRPGMDDDLIAFFDRTSDSPNSRAVAVIAALRAGGINDGATSSSSDNDKELSDALESLLF